MKIDVSKLVDLQKQKTMQWHNEECAITESHVYAFVEENHMNNFLLWHDEDKARRDDMGAEYVYKAKRNIDGYNQQRNNCMEKMDEWIFHHYQPQQDCPCHSETPGMIIDRLSILALKYYHMHEQTMRADVNAEHVEHCQRKCNVIAAQLDQLKQCLQELLDAIVAGTRTFRVYHQFKMYNDEKLNPQLYRNDVGS